METLYALAGMFLDEDSMDKNKLSGESIEVKSSAPPETVESPVTAIEGFHLLLTIWRFLVCCFSVV